MTADERIVVFVESDNRTVIADVEQTVVGASSGASKTIVVDPDDNKILQVIEPTGRPSDVIRMILPGPPGEAGQDGSNGQDGSPGPTGPRGLSGGSYSHAQAVPSATWIIDHNLGFIPSITVLDTLGRVVLGEITHPTMNRTVAAFSAGFSGSAYLS